MSQYFGILYTLSDWTTILYIIPSVFIAFWAHGIMHAYLARRYNCFDKTENASFTFNPLKYIDIIGFVFMCVVGYGCCKTAPVDMRKLKKGQKIKLYLAGPVGNIIAAAVMLVIQAVLLVIALNAGIQTNAVVDAVLFFMNMVIWANIIMFATHILPVPGFNGYNILKTLFFENRYNKYVEKIENSGKLIFVVLAVIGGLYYCAEIPAMYIYKYMTAAEEWLVDFVTGGLYSGSSWTPK